MDSIIQLNGVNCDVLSVGQVLKIPRPTPTPSPAPTNTLNPTEAAAADCSKVEVIVKAGDTMGGIAANYAVSPESIQAYNNKPNDVVYEGEKLIIPLCEQRLETASPTPVPPYAAPNLLLPADGASYVNPSEVITLQWSSVGTLRQNEAYAVTVEDVTEGNARKLVQYVTDTKLIVPESFRPTSTSPHVFRWSVLSVRQVGTDKDSGNPIWEPGGAVSGQRVFSWVGTGSPLHSSQRKHQHRSHKVKLKLRQCNRRSFCLFYPLRFQVFHRLHGCRCAHARRGNYLAEVWVGCFARRVYARDAGFHQHVGLDISQVIQLELTFEQLGIGGMADEDEHSIRRMLALLAGQHILQPHRFHGFFTEDFR